MRAANGETERQSRGNLSRRDYSLSEEKYNHY